jgi:heme-degrading monooxygenase HmoA
MTTARAEAPFRVARVWRGRVRAERADEYAAYLAEAGLKVLAEAAIGVEQFREDQRDIVEFVTISYWESVEAMTRYTHGDPTAIHHLARDSDYLTEMPERVQVLQLTSRHWRQ